MRSRACTWMRLIETFCTPVTGLRAITMPAVMYGPLSNSLWVGMGSCASRSTSRSTTSWQGAAPASTSRHGSGDSAALRNASSSPADSTPRASAIQARCAMKPDTTGMAWPPGRGK